MNRYDYWKAWFILIPVVIGSDGTKHIWCTDENVRSQMYLVQGIKKEEMLCEAVSTNKYPWTLGKPKEGATSPAPDSMEIKYRTYRTNGASDSWQIAIHVSWLYRAKYFEHVEQYHVEMNYINPIGTPKQYLMQWDKNLTSVINNTSATYLKFHFIYSGGPGHYHIHPDHIYVFMVQSCPIYRSGDPPQSLEKVIIIPGCGDETISRTSKCSKQSSVYVTELETVPVTEQDTTLAHHRTLQNLIRERHDNKLVRIVLLVISSLLIIGFVIAFICFCQRSKVMCCIEAEQQFETGLRRILLVCTTDDRFLKLINQLIVMLSKFPDLEVSCNLRQKNEIGDLGIHNWTAQGIGNADVIAFIVANTYELPITEMSCKEKEGSGLDNIEQQQVRLVIRAAEKICLNNSDTVSQKTFVLVDISNCCDREIAPCFKHLKLPEGFGNLMKIVAGEAAVGKQNLAKDEELFRKRLDDAQKCWVRNEGLNNLDLSFSTLKENDLNLSTLNLTSDGPLSCESYQVRSPSCESSRSLPYVTTDFNDNRSRPERLRLTGAISKV